MISILIFTDLSRKILRGIALALCSSADAFEGEIAGDAFWVLRIIGYPGASNEKSEELAQNDIGWYCILFSDSANTCTLLVLLGLM